MLYDVTTARTPLGVRYKAEDATGCHLSPPPGISMEYECCTYDGSTTNILCVMTVL